jgi:membrane protein implicated in regulation of membrane protease activity
MMDLNQVLVIGGLILILAELFVGIQTGFDLVLLGSILVLGGLSGWISSSLYVSLGVSTVLSLMYIVYGRTFVKNRIVILTHKTNIDKLIGKVGVVVRSITPDTAGMIRLDDEDWRATSEEVIYEKEKAEVQMIEGVTLKVKKSESQRSLK